MCKEVLAIELMWYSSSQLIPVVHMHHVDALRSYSEIYARGSSVQQAV
jgi:hypothetical protein